MHKPTPAVIRGPELADILRKFADWLRQLPDDDVFLVKSDSKPGLASTPPSLSLVIKFDPHSLVAKTIAVATTKNIVKQWNKDHGV